MPPSLSSRSDRSFRPRIAAPTLRELYDYWLARCGDRWTMRRADLDPIEIPLLLKNLIMADVGDGGRDIRYRLVGTDIVAAHGMEYTGMTVEELTSGATLDYTRRLYGIVVTDSVPVYSEGPFQWTDKEYRWTKRLHLPMSRDGGTVDLVLAAQVFEHEQPDGFEQLIAARPDQLAADRADLSAP